MLDTIIKEFSGTFSAVPVPVSVTRLVAAMILGAIIGLERELQEKPAGLRTNMLGAIAACLFVIVGIELAELDFGDSNSKRADPLRLIEAVTAGVAFLAAGLIFTSGGKVRNMDVVPNTCAVRRVVILAENGHMIPFAGDCFRSDFDQM